MAAGQQRGQRICYNGGSQRPRSGAQTGSRCLSYFTYGSANLKTKSPTAIHPRLNFLGTSYSCSRSKSSTSWASGAHRDPAPAPNVGRGAFPGPSPSTRKRVGDLSSAYEDVRF